MGTVASIKKWNLNRVQCTGGDIFLWVILYLLVFVAIVVLHWYPIMSFITLKYLVYISHILRCRCELTVLTTLFHQIVKWNIVLTALTGCWPHGTQRFWYHVYKLMDSTKMMVMCGTRIHKIHTSLQISIFIILTL